MRTPPVILSIAGHDPSSGAGVTADVKTAAALGCYAVTCVTALTVQSTQGVFRVKPVDPEVVSQTLEKLYADVPIAAVRIGMLGSGAVADSVANFLDQRRPPNVVLDPVLQSSSGFALLDGPGVEILRRRILPLCEAITPNIFEAMLLAGHKSLSSDMNWLSEARHLAGVLHELGAKAVVITGGHLKRTHDFLSDRRSGEASDEVFPGERIESTSTHGTGCAFAMALACRLALGDELRAGVRAAKEYVRKAILNAYPLGKGTGPLNHFA